MKAIVIHEYGPPDVLRYQDLPDPVPRQGEIRIKVHAATVNRVLDVSLRAGREQYRGPVLPLIPGVDCAGIVDAVGPQVSRWHVGDRVAAAGIMPLDVCAEDGSGYDGPAGHDGHQAPRRLRRACRRAGAAPASPSRKTSTFIAPPWSCATYRRRGICSCTSPSSNTARPC